MSVRKKRRRGKCSLPHCSPSICARCRWWWMRWMLWKNEDNMKIALIIIGVLVLIGLLFGGKLIGVRNDLVTQREAINGAWSQVDVDLQRRSDLVPNLVETVKGFAKHETEVFTAIANARAALIGGKTPQEKIAANDQLTGALSRL